jgi:hypothetical protein
MTIPKHAEPGQHDISIHGGNGGSQTVQYNVSGYRYRIVFENIHCVDETDSVVLGIASEAGSDEIVTAWCVVADGTPSQKATGEYPGFDDGEDQPYKPGDALVMDWTEIRQDLGLVTEVWEWDEGDINAAKKWVAVEGGLLSLLFGGTPGVPVGGLASAATGLVLSAFETIAGWFGAGNHRIGRTEQVWTRPQLAKDVPVGKSKSYKLDFDSKSEKWGHYVLTYQLHRQP